MKNDTAYTITKVSWLTEREGIENLGSTEFWIRRFWVLVNFLQGNGLTTRQLFLNEFEIDSQSQIQSTDLNEEGIELIKVAYEKYSDSCRPPKIETIKETVLARALLKLREKRGK